MRPLERIDEISDLIKEIWNENPDMRNMQRLYTLQSSFSQKNMDVGNVEERVDKTSSRIGFDLFSIEDKEFKIFLENYLCEQKNVMLNRSNDADSRIKISLKFTNVVTISSFQR